MYWDVSYSINDFNLGCIDYTENQLRQDTWNKPNCIKSKLKMQMLENEPSSWLQPLNKIYAKNIFQCFDFKIENQKVFPKGKKKSTLRTSVQCN